MRRITVLAVMVFLAIAPAVAQGFGNDCTPAGTWYGGGASKAKYLLTIVPTRAGHFSIRADEGFPAAIPKLSEFSGEMTRSGDGYEAFVIGLGNTSPTPPTAPADTVPAAQNPFVWAIKEHVTLTNCNQLDFEIYFSKRYAWGTVPFSTDFMLDMLPPPGMPGNPAYETYLRAVPQ